MNSEYAGQHSKGKLFVMDESAKETHKCEIYAIQHGNLELKVRIFT